MTEAVHEAVAAALAGRLIVLATDTVYGIGTRPDDPAATARIFQTKGRRRELTLPVLVASLKDAERVAVLDERARALAEAHWPGALTMVLPRSAVSAAWELGAERDTVGVRVPDHPLALSVLSRSGPLAVTSANRSGEEAPRTCDEVRALFGDAVEVYLCQAEPTSGVASTVIDLTGDVRVLRRGAVELGWTLEWGWGRD